METIKETYHKDEKQLHVGMLIQSKLATFIVVRLPLGKMQQPQTGCFNVLYEKHFER